MGKIKDILNSPEMEEFRKAWKEQQERYKNEATEFWNNLSYDDSLKAFYYVTSKIYEGDVEKRGSYRYVLYDVFGFDMDAYTIGMDAKYLELHNIIFDGCDYMELKNANKITLNNNSISIEGNNKFKFDYDEEKKELTISVVDLMNWEL